ncbi:hypothetical protein [Streptomyces albus]|uniref:hypothetical protein n=1 Tax=Streptomyces albus TaxID=1888 RepID=UPI00131A9116|nr:hypothetical protein [Streptomyces albus]
MPSFSQEGRTRILRHGDAEAKATPKENGVFTAVTVHNDTDEPAHYDIVVSIGDGVEENGARQGRRAVGNARCTTRRRQPAADD